MIEIKQLTKHYGSLTALDHLDLTIKEGDIFGYIGPNGAGKTTTMRVLATLLNPTFGQAFIDGLDVTKKGKEVRCRLGYMPDFMGVYDDLKVFEYLEFFAAAFKIERKKRQGIVEGVLELTDPTSKKHFTVDSPISSSTPRRAGVSKSSWMYFLVRLFMSTNAIVRLLFRVAPLLLAPLFSASFFRGFSAEIFIP